jgi:hypothetical protein
LSASRISSRSGSAGVSSLHRQAQHGRQQAQHAQQILLGGSSAHSCAASSQNRPAHKGHAQNLLRLPGVQFAGDGQRGNAAEGLLAHGQQRRLDRAHLLPHMHTWAS